MPDNLGRPYVYLAGPDVFYPDPLERAAPLKRALAARGMRGLFPMDNQFDPAQYPDPKDLGIAIGMANEAMMVKSDMIIANVQPWRGTEADDGTAYEVGFMRAQGKIVILYTNDPRPFAARVVQDYYHGKVHQDGPFTRGDSDNLMIEAFPGFADNLMLVNAAVQSQERFLGVKPDPASVIQSSFKQAADLAVSMWERRMKSAFNAAADQKASGCSAKQSLTECVAKKLRTILRRF